MHRIVIISKNKINYHFVSQQIKQQICLFLSRKTKLMSIENRYYLLLIVRHFDRNYLKEPFWKKQIPIS